MKKLGSARIIIWAAIILIGFGAIYIIAQFLIYPAEYVRRSLFSGKESVYDYKVFPERALKPSAAPYHFVENKDEARVRSLLEADPRIKDLPAFLEKTGTQAFIVIKGGAILYEGYFNGAQRDTLLTSFSTVKSFDSALVGIAIHEGYIKSVDDPMTDYLPEMVERDPRFAGITIRDLLRMASGLRFDENRFGLGGDGNLTYRYPDMRDLALNHTVIVSPPGEFLYNPYNPLLLGLILERATGKPVTQYLQDKLWDPLGMEFSGSFSLDSQSSGFEKMESGLNARAIDFAKLGELYLRRGSWNGVQVVPAEWVEESTRLDPGFAGGQYAYMWWGMARSEAADDFSAAGNLGQYIYVSPASDLVIVRNGEKYGIDSSYWPDIFFQFATAIGKQ